MSGPVDGVDLDAAVRLLGVAPDATPAQVRAAYRRALLRTHPDHSGDADAAAPTIRLRSAYELLAAQREVAADPQPPVATGAGPAEGPVPDGCPGVVVVTVVDADTIGLDAPPAEALALLVDAAHRLGEVSYLDRAAGLVEVVVEFTEAPTSSVLMSLQGRSSGTTEVFCTVEPLSGGEAPPPAAVVALVARTLRGEDPSS